MLKVLQECTLIFNQTPQSDNAKGYAEKMSILQTSYILQPNTLNIAIMHSLHCSLNSICGHELQSFNLQFNLYSVLFSKIKTYHNSQ